MIADANNSYAQIGQQGSIGQGFNDQPLTIGGVLKEIQTLKDKFKNEDEDEPSPYQMLEKATVLQECRVFNDSNVVTNNPKRCCHLITKLLHLLTQGETFTSNEVTDVFFGVTKLFQSKDHNLRRMMYLFIKEVAEATNPDDVIIVTSSLTKDMNSSEDLYRANSIRVLARIIDAAMLGAIERYLKQAINDKNPIVASSALVSGYSLYYVSPEVVKRWQNEVNEALNSSNNGGNDMVQYHALALLYQCKCHDRLAVTKLVSQLIKSTPKSPLAICLLIRYAVKMLNGDLNAANAKSTYQFLESCLRNRNEIVIYEAARAICNLPSIEINDISSAVTVLQLSLSSPKSTLRYGAMKALSEIASRHPLAIVKCNEEMEILITDPNRSIATLAITTLLKTGTEGSIDRLMKQISTFMGDIADEFKVIVVDAIRELCLRYPQKNRMLVGYLATFLREEGGFEFKKAIADSIVEVMNSIPDTKENCLFHLCDFIEDCEFAALSTQILHLIGSIGPFTSAPSRYIRYIYNRVILESASVRAAAVSSLTKFAMKVPSLRSSVIVLLKRSLSDEDNEVRDRATLSLYMIQSIETSVENSTENEDDSNFAAPNDISPMLFEPLPMSFDSLEKALDLYSMNESPNQPLVFTSLPIVEEDITSSKNPKMNPNPRLEENSKMAVGQNASIPSSSSMNSDPTNDLYKIPEIASLGRLFRSTSSIALTENETEYLVHCVKHIFDSHVVFDFSINNTIPDQMLVQVEVVLESQDDELYKIISTIPIPLLKYGKKEHCYVILERDLGCQIESSTFSCELHFKVLDVDPSTGEPDGEVDGTDGFPEEYPLEQLEISPPDYMAKVNNLGDFRRGWEQLGTDFEVVEKFALQFRRLEEAVSGVLDFLGMQACDGTGVVQPRNEVLGPPHTLHLCGVFVGNIPVLVRAQLGMTKTEEETIGCILKIAVRSNDPDVSRTIADCIH